MMNMNPMMMGNQMMDMNNPMMMGNQMMDMNMMMNNQMMDMNMNPMMMGNQMMGMNNPMMMNMNMNDPTMMNMNPMMMNNQMMDMNMMMNMNMNQMMMNQANIMNNGNSNNDEGGEQWNLVFENQNDNQSNIIRISPQKLVKEAINKYKIMTMRKDKMKFIFNNKELFPEMKICQTGLKDLSKILVISIQNLKGA